MTVTWVDSHLHFDSFEEAGEVSELMARAEDTGVARMVAIGGRDAANRLVMEMTSRYPGRVFGSVGFDRDLAGETVSDLLLREQVVQPAVVAVGESGLDYHYEPETAEAQRALFGQMLSLAVEVGKPMVIHSRDAEDDMLAMLKEYTAAWRGDPGRCGVLHCFTGDTRFASQLLDLGLMISLSGIVTFKNASSLREVAAYVPLDRLLVETDAPYLAPVPHRGKRNEPGFVPCIGAEIAAVREIPVEEVATATTANAHRFFGLSGV